MSSLSPHLGLAAAPRVVTCDVGDLRQQIRDANAMATPTTLYLQAGCVYTLVDADTSSAADGLPAISNTVTIEGNGDTITRSTAADTPAFRILHVFGGGNLTVNKLTVSNGNSDGSGGAQGGGIYNQGTLRVLSSTISGNQATGSSLGNGGGIRSQGPLTIVDSVISGNTATADATGNSGSASALGGGISVKGSNVDIRNTSITGNSASATTTGRGTATTSGGGLYMESRSGTGTDTVVINRSTIAGNTVSGRNLSGGTVNARGGGISMKGDYGRALQAQVVNSTIASNRVAVPSGSAGPRTEQAAGRSAAALLPTPTAPSTWSTPPSRGTPRPRGPGASSRPGRVRSP